MHFYEIAKLHSILPSSSITLWARKIDFYSACPVTPSLMSQISQECVIIKRNKMLTRGISNVLQGVFYWFLKVSFCVLVLIETCFPQFLTEKMLNKQYQFIEE